ncbi:hypothetical protein [Luteolibacter soli]|uniref:Uncharacterized protein n=1 Tax=Luteolibacter soli TaxID=3135280 RepID=A0ABU9AYF7_9BACT
MPKTKSLYLEVANFVVKFGDHLNLVDLFEEVVAPALTDDTLRRSFTGTHYLLHEPRLVNLKDDLGVVGRLVKDEVIASEQQLIENELRPTEDTLHSSPSSLFLLVVGSHRLIYVRENTGSPSVGTFQATLAKFLKLKHKAFIDFQSKIEHPGIGRMQKKQLVEKYPYPSISITPIANEGSVEDFIKKFARLKSITTTLKKTNSEFDNDGLFDQVRTSQDLLKSTKTTLRYENKEGLNKDEATKQVAALAKQGNHDLQLNGVDFGGSEMKGDEDSLKLKHSIPELSEDLESAALELYGAFKRLKKTASIIVPDVIDKVKEKVRMIKDSYGL